nr:MAG: peptidase C69 [Vulcanisaeta sp. AZ3]
MSADESVLSKAVDLALSMGSTYAEARFQVDSNRFVNVRNGALQSIGNYSYGGLSIRVLVDGMWGFAATSDASWDSIRDAVSKAVASARAVARIRVRKISLGHERLARVSYEVNGKVKVEDISDDYLIKYLTELDSHAKAEPRIRVRNLFLNVRITEKTVVTSDGAYVRSKVPRTYLFGSLIAYDPQKGSAQRNVEVGGSGGFEIIDGTVDTIDREVNAIKDVLDKAKPLPHDDVMDVILSPELAGIMVHESVGHPSELDRIMGREGAEAGESYMRIDYLGTFKLGSDYVTIIDDPTIPNSYGYYLVDEEGVQARPRYLIKNGYVNEFLMNREYAKYISRESNAAARASEFDKEPIPRMANTYLAPGNWKPEEIIRETKRGLFIVSYTEWNIDDKRWFGRYGGFEAYYVENGDLKYMVRNPFIEVNTKTLWSNVDAVANDLTFYPGTCGKGNPEQGVPVFLGGPTFRVNNIRVLKAPTNP